MERDQKVFVVGHDEMIGSAIVRRLEHESFQHLTVKDPSELDLLDQRAVLDFFLAEKPRYVFMTGGKIGGILANSRYPADFIYLNLQVQVNVIHSAWKAGVEKLLFLGSSCVYPGECQQPIKEEYLLTGRLEATSEPYAIARIAGIRMCQSYNAQHGTDYISVIPSDVYGPNDNFDPETGHVLPAIIAKMHRARECKEEKVVLWGTGTPRRECFHADDLADACVYLMDEYSGSGLLNVGSGEEISIKELAFLIKEIVGYEGEIEFDTSKPDGSPRKLLDSNKLRAMGWTPGIGLVEGIEKTCEWYYQNEVRETVKANER